MTDKLYITAFGEDFDAKVNKTPGVWDGPPPTSEDIMKMVAETGHVTLDTQPRFDIHDLTQEEIEEICSLGHYTYVDKIGDYEMTKKFWKYLK